jgi:MFS transporter, CP family, cyanate transporter
VAVMNVMMPSVLRRRFPRHLGEMTAAYTMALSIGAGLAAGFTVPLVQALGGSVATALAIWAIPAAIAFAVWLPQVRWPLPARRAEGPRLVLMRDAQAWQITLFFGLQSALFYTLLSWLPTIYRDHGTSPVVAGAVLSFMTAIGIAGNFAAPLLANRFGRPRLAVLTAGGLTLLGLIGVLLYPTGLPFLWAAMIGVGTAGTFSVTLLLMASRGADAVVAARLSSMAQGIGYLVSALGPLGAGVLHAATHGWAVPLIAVIAVCVAQLVSGVGAARQRTISA